MPNRVRWFTSLRTKLAALITIILILGVGGTYWYIIETQSRQFIETTKDQAAVLTHAIVKSIRHDMRGDCAKDVQGIFERIAVVEDIESLRIFDEDGKVTRSSDKREVGLTIDDIGLEIFKAGASRPCLPRRARLQRLLHGRDHPQPCDRRQSDEPVHSLFPRQ